MVRQYGVVTKLNREAIDQQFEPVADPAFPVAEIPPGQLVLAAEVRPPDAPRRAMMNPDLAVDDDFLSSELGHNTPPAGHPLLE